MHISDLLAHQSGHRCGGAIPPPYVPLEERAAIHVTDLLQYAQCRRRWDWSSPLRMGLQPAILPAPLQLGMAIHYAMERGYRGSATPNLPLFLPPPPPSAPVPMHFELSEAIEAFYRAMEQRRQLAVEHSGPLWPSEKEEFNTLEQLGAAMLVHYSLWAPAQDKPLRLLGTERHFRLPIPGSKTLCYEGRFDGLVQDAQGRLLVLEFKTSRSLKQSTLSGTFRSVQATMYTWAASQLYNVPVQGVLFRMLYKRIPDTPRVLKKGTFSRAKTQKITSEWAKHCLDKMATKAFHSLGKPSLTLLQCREQYHAAAQALLHMLAARPNEFFIQKLIPKGPPAIEQALHALKVLGEEMANKHTPTPAVTGFHCGWCPFTDPCDLLTMGESEAAYAVLEAEYSPRDYWEPEEEVQT